MTTLFKNAQIITPTGITPGEVLVQKGLIAQVCFDGSIDAVADRVVDVQGKYLSPGLA